MSKFVYEEGDLQIGGHQCDLCRFQITEDCLCEIYGNIPVEVSENKIKCEGYKHKGKPYPWESE